MFKRKLRKTRAYLQYIRARTFFDRFDFKIRQFLLPTGLSFLAAACDGLSVALLVPVVKGVIEADFKFAYQAPFVGGFLEAFPTVFKNSNAAIFIFFMMLVLFALGAKIVFRYLSSLMISEQALRFASKLRKKIFSRYLSLGKYFFDQHNVGELHQTLAGHTQALANLLVSSHNILLSLFTLCVYLAILLWLSWPLTLVAVCVFPVLHFLVRGIVEKIEKYSVYCADTQNEMGRKIFNSLSCIPLVKAYSNEEKEKGWFNYTSNRVERLQVAMKKKRLMVEPIREIVTTLMLFALVAATAYLFLKKDQGDLPAYAVFFVLLRRLSSNMGIFNTVQVQIAGARGAIKKISYVFNEKNKHYVHGGRLKFSGLQKSIRFSQASFSYGAGEPVLKNTTVEIEKGAMTAIVGPSGSGKTTLIQLLMRYYDVLPGMVFVDGKDIREFSVSSLRAHMALVSQETFILNAPLRLNLAYGLPDVSDEEIVAAASKARLDNLVRLIGLDAHIGDRGCNLSGGEKQRLSIARAILKKTEILILDEATSALDSMTEKLIQESINEAIKGRTSVVIAHRLSTVKHADKIIFLEDGTVKEEGSFKELLEKKGLFYEAWQQQVFF